MKTHLSQVSIALQPRSLRLAIRALNISLCTALTAGAVCTWSAPSFAQKTDKDFFKIKDSELTWTAGEHGMRSSVVYGDPSKAGIYVVRNIFPPGIMSAPHTHDQDRYVTVIRGTWNAGTSANWDPSGTTALPQGAFMFHPAGGVHFDGSLKEEVEVQIIGMGPVKTNFVHPELGHFGAPRKLD